MRAGDKQLPDADSCADAWVAAAVPVVELSDHRPRRAFRRPDGKTRRVTPSMVSAWAPSVSARAADESLQRAAGHQAPAAAGQKR